MSIDMVIENSELMLLTGGGLIAYKDFQPYKCEITKSEIDLTSIPSRWAPVVR